MHDVLMQAADVAVWQWDPLTDDLRWYSPMRQMLGMATATDGEIALALRSLLKPIMVAPYCSDEVIELEHSLRLPRKADRRFHLHARWSLLSDAGGADGGDRRVLTGTVIDVTNDRVSAPPAELQDRYRLLVELSPDAICVHCAGDIVFVNRAGIELMGATSADELVGHPIFGFVSPESRPALIQRIAAMSETDTYSEPAEATLMRLDGTTVVVESTSVRTRWEDKPAFQAIMRDLTGQKAAEASLRLQAKLIESVTDSIIATDVDGRITSWNPAACQLYGWTAAEAIGQSAAELLDDEEGTGIDQLARGTRAELTQRRRDGDAVYVLLSLADIRDSSGTVTGSVMISSDIGERRKAERIRQQADARYSAAVAALDEGVIIVNADDTVETANPAALALLGCPTLIGSGFGESVTLLDELGQPLRAIALGLDDARGSGAARPAFTAAVRRPGAPLTFLSVSIRSLPTETGTGPFPVVMCFLDVTDRHAAAALLRYEARHDHMTGLANRNLVLETISGLLAEPDNAVGVLFIDLDRFKMVNDSLGHDAGDAVLRTIARRLAHDGVPSCTVGRLAGDEFVVVVPNATEFQMQELAKTLLNRLSKPVRISGRDVVVTCSIGIVVTAPGVGLESGGTHRVGATDVLRDADVAMYYAKQHGRNRLATFDERFRRRAVDRLELEEELRNGLEHDQLWPAFQPIVSLADHVGQSTGHRIASVEALARWSHPKRGNVPPTVFIPIAEETGLIASLGQRMLERSIGQVSHWRNEFAVPDLVVSVNLSPRQLADPGIADRVNALLQARGLPAEALTLEITESALMDDPELAAQSLTKLRELGVGISVDDFGTGYSSLSYLRRFPVTSVKIDRSFVESLGLTKDDDAIVAGIINLAHTLGLTVVAEGVEEAGQLATLTGLGCDYAQGYLFSRPLAADDLTPLLRVPALPASR